MAVTAVAGVEARRPVPRQRVLEDERWLALALLMPTAILLGLFIAYPFFEGIMLSLTNTRVDRSSLSRSRPRRAAASSAV